MTKEELLQEAYGLKDRTDLTELQKWNRSKSISRSLREMEKKMIKTKYKLKLNVMEKVKKILIGGLVLVGMGFLTHSLSQDFANNMSYQDGRWKNNDFIDTTRPFITYEE